MLNPYQPRTPQVFWCNSCDHRRVDSAAAETGTFHIQSGHAYDPKTQEYDGDYHMVMFAICRPCAEAVKKSLTD